MSADLSALGAGAGMQLHAAQRIVIKIGSALLYDETDGGAKQDWMQALADDVAWLTNLGKEVVLVSSGSIALGRHVLGLGKGRIKLAEKQAAAAAGQVQLVEAWTAALSRHDLKSAQILLAPDDTETRRRHLNARDTFQALLSLGVVPVVNENDTITTYEIRFGDNDRLAARVAAMISADLLILLSDVDGLYDRNPQLFEDAQHIPDITQITPDILEMGGASHNDFASGGMATKLAAAQIATRAGVAMLICDGRPLHPVRNLDGSAKSSLFHAQLAPQAARKSWIAGALDIKGQVRCDAGASAALKKGKSLLPIGVVEVSGSFERGDLIAILDSDGHEIARGLAGYNAKDAALIKRHKSDAFTSLIGYDGRPELVHADDLVLLGDSN
ncbi:MAG: glutamate 5-kinase [Candidatus Puniceispirillaceae bacterium]